MQFHLHSVVITCSLLHAHSVLLVAIRLTICWRLTVLLWEDSITNHCSLTSSQCKDSICHLLLAHCTTVPRFHHHSLLARCVSMRRLPVHLLTLAYIVSSRFSVLPYSSKQCYMSLSLKSMRRLWCYAHLTQRHWLSTRSDIRGFPGCILLGIAASHYNIMGTWTWFLKLAFWHTHSKSWHKHFAGNDCVEPEQHINFMSSVLTFANQDVGVLFF
jgi:hypothetical protein